MSTTTYALSPGAKLLLLDMGLEPERVLKRARLPTDLFSRGPIRLTAADYNALWESLEAEAGEHSLPVMIAQSLSVEVFDPPIFAAVCSPDLNRAAERIGHYKPLIGPIRLTVERDETSTTLVKTWPKGLEPVAALGHSELLFWVSLVRLATRTRLEPVRMTAPLLPRRPAPIRDYAGIAIGRGPTWSVSFSADDAARPFLTSNEPMWSFFEPELRTKLSELKAEATTAERVRAVLHELLPAGDVSAETVGRRLAFSKRTLQRRLSAEGTTFQALLNTTRESLARHYLLESRLSSAEISFLLGYEDPNSFYRAFSTWTGQTPETLRAAAAPD